MSVIRSWWRLIAEARIKTDKIDAAILGQLYASGFLPEVWMPDDTTLALCADRSHASRQDVLRAHADPNSS